MEIESWPKTFVFFLHNHNHNHHNHNQPSAIRPTKHKYGWSEIALKGGKLAHMSDLQVYTETSVSRPLLILGDFSILVKFCNQVLTELILSRFRQSCLMGIGAMWLLLLFECQISVALVLFNF